MMGNKAYYANRQLVNSSLISRNSKLQIYRTLVRPVITYDSESWTLTMEEERALAVFERKILRKIYGPVKSWSYRKNARHRNPKKYFVQKAICNKTKRKTKNEMAG